MVIEIDELKTYLPSYLSEESYEKMISQIKYFTKKAEDFYFNYSEKHILQGDHLVIQIENKEKNVLIISNTCDISPENQRITPINMTYCPIVKLKKLIKSFDDSTEEKIKVKNFKINLKNNRITNLIYLPDPEDEEDGFVAVLDKITNIDNSQIDYDKYIDKRVFSLSNYGFYLFLLKISIHFTRILEKVDRN